MIQHSPECPTGNLFPHLRIAILLCELRHLNEHAGDKINAFKQLEIDVHVERKLPGFFYLLLLRSKEDIAMSCKSGQPLKEELLHSLCLYDFAQCLFTLLDQSASKGTETELNQSSIKKSLCFDIGVRDIRLDVGHIEHVTSSVVVVMQCAVINMAKHSAQPDSRTSILVEVDADIPRKSRRSCSSYLL